MTYKITPRDGHYEIYINEQFYCSADTWNEAEKEIEEYKKEIISV